MGGGAKSLLFLFFSSIKTKTKVFEKKLAYAIGLVPEPNELKL